MLTTLSVSLVILIFLLHAARFTTGYVRLVGQETAPSKCVLLSTSGEIRKGMKDWVLSLEGDQWSVKFDVRDLGGHLDTTFRGWSSTLAAKVRLVISRLVLVFVLPLVGFGSSVPCICLLLYMVLRPLYLLLVAFGSFVLLFVESFGLVGSLLLVLVLSLVFWMGLLVVILLFVWCGSGFGCFAGILHFGPRRLVGFTVFWRW